jgi:hypothetical protein
MGGSARCFSENAPRLDPSKDLSDAYTTPRKLDGEAEKPGKMRSKARAPM